ncbi:MAG: hypothetical protein ACK559_09845, partial [bacterium]
LDAQHLRGLVGRRLHAALEAVEHQVDSIRAVAQTHKQIEHAARGVQIRQGRLRDQQNAISAIKAANRDRIERAADVEEYKTEARTSQCQDPLERVGTDLFE